MKYISLFLIIYMISFGQKVTRFTEVKDVRALFYDKQSIWVGTRADGLHRYKMNRWEKIDSPAIPSGVTSIVLNQSGQIQVAGAGGFSSYDSYWKKVSLKDDMKIQGKVIFNMRKIENQIWFSTPGGTVIYDGKTYTSITTDNGLKHNVVHDIIKYKDAIYFATRKGVLNIFANGKWTYLLPEKNCRSLLIDHQNHLWVGTSTGVYEFDGQNWTEHHPDKLMLPLALDTKNKQILFTSEGLGLFFYNGKHWRFMNRDDGLSSVEIFTAIQINPGQFWIRHKQGIDLIKFQ